MLQAGSAQQCAGLGQDEIADYQQKNQDPWQPGAEHAVQNIIHTLWLHHGPQYLLQFSNRAVGAPGICNLRSRVVTAPSSQAQTAPFMPLANFERDVGDPHATHHGLLRWPRLLA